MYNIVTAYPRRSFSYTSTFRHFNHNISVKANSRQRLPRTIHIKRSPGNIITAQINESILPAREEVRLALIRRWLKHNRINVLILSLCQGLETRGKVTPFQGRVSVNVDQDIFASTEETDDILVAAAHVATLRRSIDGIEPSVFKTRPFVVEVEWTAVCRKLAGDEVDFRASELAEEVCFVGIVWCAKSSVDWRKSDLVETRPHLPNLDLVGVDGVQEWVDAGVLVVVEKVDIV